MTDKIMTLADAYAEYRDHSEYVHCRAALSAAIKAEQGYTAAVIDERDAFCVEADVLRMALTAMQSERDRLHKVTQQALNALQIIWQSGDEGLDLIEERLVDAAMNQLKKEIGHE